MEIQIGESRGRVITWLKMNSREKNEKFAGIGLENVMNDYECDMMNVIKGRVEAKDDGKKKYVGSAGFT